MKALLLITFFLLVSLNVVGQAPARAPTPACPNVTISVPGFSESYMSRGSTYYLTASVDYYHGATPLSYEWKLPPKPEFTIDPKGSSVSFIAAQELDGLEVTVGLTLTSKAPDCRTEAIASFQILFNPGSPLILDAYGGLSTTDERQRLDVLALQLGEKAYNALFVIGYTLRDTKSSVSTRVERIMKQLVEKRGIGRDRLLFVYIKSGYRSTTIYALPKGLEPPDNPDWTADIEKLPVSQRKKRN